MRYSQDKIMLMRLEHAVIELQRCTCERHVKNCQEFINKQLLEPFKHQKHLFERILLEATSRANQKLQLQTIKQ